MRTALRIAGVGLVALALALLVTRAWTGGWPLNAPGATPPAITTPAPLATRATEAPSETLVPSPTAQTEGPLGRPGSWRLAFSDDFTGPGLNQATWHTCFWWATTTCSIESNAEQQLYNPEDVLVQDGMLRLRAQHRQMTGWNGNQYQFTSGMVSTGGRKDEKPPGFTFTYGYVEAQVRVPRGQGLWSSFWMLPVSYASLPEIDIFEILGHQANNAQVNYHWQSTVLHSERQKATVWSGPDFSAGWHTFGLDWQPDTLVWYVDGVERGSFSAGPGAPVPSEPMYVLLTLAVGGDWPGPPDASTPFPSYLDTRFVRIWERT